MKCKYCNVLLDDDVTVCPVCGKSQAEEAETVVHMPDLELDESGDAIPAEAVDQAPELTPYTQTTVGEAMDAKPKRSKKAVIFLCVLGAIFSFLLVVGSVVGILFALEILPVRDNDIHYRDNYTVSDQKVMQNADKVVATMCDTTLTNGKLQIYYWMYVSEYLYDNQYYLTTLGLDYSKPFNEQTFYFDKTMNWQQGFLSFALDNWYRYTCLYQLATEANFELDDELEKAIQDLPKNMESTVVQYGYSSLDEMLKAELGPTCTIEMYMDYMRVYYTGISYFTQIYEAVDPTMAEIEAYFAKNEELLATNKITKDSGYLVDVRHILLQPEDVDKDNTLSDAEWETCRQKSQALLDQWLAGAKDEDSFAALANEHSTDPGSNTNGGLYTGVAEGDMVEAFDDWIFDETRKKGDHGLVKTNYGYHIMFFSGTEDVWIYQCREGIREERSSEVLKIFMDANPLDVDYKKIVLADVQVSG